MISFREKMDMYDKDSVKAFASSLGLHKISQLKKADLIEKLADEVLNPDKLFYRLSILSDDIYDLFRAGIESDITAVSDQDDFDRLCTLNELEVGAFGDDNSYSTLSDIGEIFKKHIAGKKFEAYRDRASWVWKCLYWVENMYGVAPESLVLKLVQKKKSDMTVEELRTIFDHFPSDQLTCTRIDDVYIDDIYAYHDTVYDNLVRAQADKEYYEPTVDEVEELFSTGALLSRKPYQDMLNYLTHNMKMNYHEAESLLFDLWDDITLENDPQSSLQWFMEQLPELTKTQLNKMLSLFMALANGTNRLINRGYAPSDMPTPVFKPGQMPTLVPGSSNAAKMLSEAMPEIKKMGFGVDLDSNAATVPVFGMPSGINGPVQATQKKVYPNDPCPCGSGKKFKKCCGRNM